jgi:hypothetical protein
MNSIIFLFSLHTSLCRDDVTMTSPRDPTDAYHVINESN